MYLNPNTLRLNEEHIYTRSQHFFLYKYLHESRYDVCSAAMAVVKVIKIKVIGSATHFSNDCIH